MVSIMFWEFRCAANRSTVLRFQLLLTCEKENLWSDMPMPFSLLFMVAEPFGACSVTIWLVSITTQS